MASPQADLLTTSSFMLIAFFFLLLSGGAVVPGARAQQPYGSAIADCNNQHNDTGMLGYFCGGGDGAPSSCATYLTFTARAPYGNLASIASLLGADAAAVAAANSVGGETAALAPGTKVVVPATCSCTATPQGRFYQRNASTYVARSGDTLHIIATDRFQGLTTCQALEAQALGGAAPESLLAGQPLATVPLRCACPSAAQRAAGARFLVSYLVREFDEISTIAARFGVDQGDVAAANRMQRPFTVLPDTTLLVPVAFPPTTSQIQSSPPPPPPPPPVPAAATPPANEKRSSRAGVYIGVGVAVAAVVVLASAGAFFALKARRRTKRGGAVLAITTGKPQATKKEGNKGTADWSAPSTFTGGASYSDAFSSVSLSDIKSSLKLYTYEELRAATGDFSSDRRIGGSVYRATFGGDAEAAVEAVDRNVSTEVEIMRKVNHLNLVRLVGLCHHQGRWYLVTEYAEHGELRDRLRSTAPALSWSQRVQIGLDVAEALQYLHEYADPPCVHMDVSSGSVLLAGDAAAAGNLRAKLRSFGAARVVTPGGAGEVLFTMTSRIAGTRGYMAPEYLEHGAVSPKADVYSLGVVLLELVTGKPVEELVRDGVGDPFAELRELVTEEHDDDDDAVLRRRMEELVDPAMSCPLEAIVMVVRLIERCVRRDAAARPRAGEVAQRLLKVSGVEVLSWRQSAEQESESPRSPGR